MRRRISGEMRRRGIFILLLTGGMIFGHLSGSSDDLQLSKREVFYPFSKAGQYSGCGAMRQDFFFFRRNRK